MRAKGKVERDLVGDTSARERDGTRGASTGWSAALRPIPATLAGAVIAAAVALAWRPEALLLVPLVALISALMGRLAYAKRRSPLESALRLPEPGVYDDSDASNAVSRLAAARNAIVVTARRAGELPGVIQAVSQLERKVLALAARLDYLGGFLTRWADDSSEPASTNGERRRDLARGADDAPAGADPAREAFRRSTAVHVRHREDVRRLWIEHDVLIATLDQLLATLESVPARLTHLRLLEIEARCGRPSEVAPDIVMLGDELAVLEEATGRRPEGGEPAGAGA